MKVAGRVLAPIFALILGVATQADAQTPAQTSPQTGPDRVEDVTVTGPDAEPVRNFVGGVTLPGEKGRFEGQIARWGADICVSVIGAVPEVNVYLTEQITANFQSLGVPHAGPGCEPTVAVVISTDADAFAEDFARRTRVRMFENRREAVARFVGPSRPVRWRHRVETGFVGPDPLNKPLAEGFGAEIGRMSYSRITRSTARAIGQAMIVVDAQRASAAPLDALAAYLAFVALIDMPPEPATAGQRTILSLFDESAGPDRARALTRWDRAFITALYRMTPDYGFGFQQTELENGMRRALAENTTAPAP